MFKGKCIKDKLEGLVYQIMNGHCERLYLKSGKVLLLKHQAVNPEIKLFNFT